MSLNLSPIRYNDYIAMVCNWDAEWSQKRIQSNNEKEILSSIYNSCIEFNSICFKHKNAIYENFVKYSAANGENIDHNDYLRPFLFNPLNYITFGNSDNLSIVMLDDFDPVHHITSEIRTTIEDVNLAFCPKIDSLKLHDYSDQFPYYEFNRKIFCDLDDIPDNDSTVFETGSIKEHSYQKELPLLSFTKIRTYGHGLLFQYYLYRAIAFKILETIENLRKSTSVKFLNSDIYKNIRITFLDLQGKEEIGLLIFTDNYSEAISLIAACRSLRWIDVFNADKNGELKNNMDVQLFNDLNVHIAESGESISNGSNKIYFEKNHVFRWTYSTLGITPNICLNPESLKSNCLIKATSEIQILPGHRKKVDAWLEKEISCQDFESIVIEEGDLFHVGVTDYIFSSRCTTEEEEKDSTNYLIPLKAFLHILNRNLIKFGSINEKDIIGRHVIDFVTHVAVPVPKTLFSDIDQEHKSFFSESLTKLRDRLCYHTQYLHENNQVFEREKNAGRLDIERLKSMFRACGLPLSLRRSIEFLYQNYALFFAKTYMYDAILDLYDTFATLHKLLVDYINNEYKERQKHLESEKVFYIENSRIVQLSDLVDAIHNAFMHRISKSYPENEYFDMAIDFRGGLNQMLYSADAPIKCGLELLKKISKNGSNNFDSIGALVKIGFNPGATCNSFDFGHNESLKLASFELDVPHVLHVASYIDNLHETAHLIYDTLYSQGMLGDKLKTLYRDRDNVMKVRLDEVYALLMCHIFIFGKDTGRFLFYHIATYSKNTISAEGSDKSIIIKFTELAIRLFYVVELMNQSTGPPFKFPKEKYRKIRSKKIRMKSEEFINFLSIYGRYFSEFPRLWGNEVVKKYCRNQFELIYPRIHRYTNELIKLAELIQDKFTYGMEKHNLNELVHQINKNVKSGISNGSPVIVKSFIKETKEKDFEKYLNFYSTLIVTQSLLRYIPNPCKKEIDKKCIHLYRDPKTRKVEFPKLDANVKWHEFQIDKGAAQTFSPVPRFRSERILKQIVIFKTFWDISAIQRESRMKEIIKSNFD